MAKLSKRAQLESMGWKFTAIPRFVEAGLIQDSSTGYKSAAYYCYEHPDGWQVTPPTGLPCEPRRFRGRSPNPAVCWAYEQAMAPRLKTELTGVAALVALMGEARSTGMVADGSDEAKVAPARPDAELLCLCREALRGDFLEHETRDGEWPCPWTDKPAHLAWQTQLGEAMQAKKRVLPRLLELKATTPAGATMKARVVATLFANSRGLRAEAVTTMVDDLVAVFGNGADPRVN